MVTDGRTPASPANVDGREIDKFAAAAAFWWDRHGAYKALHDINPLRLDYIESHAGLRGSNVIDVGCGGGLLSEGMARRGANVTGIDAGASPLAAARSHLAVSGLSVDYQRATAEEMAARHPAGFDLVTCLELLEHVPDPASTVRACSALARPGGHVVFATLNRNPKSYLFAIVAAEYILRFVPRGTHSYRRFIRPAELTAWAESSGLARLDLTGLHYNPFRRRYSLGGNHHVNYLMDFIKR